MLDVWQLIYKCLEIYKNFVQSKYICNIIGKKTQRIVVMLQWIYFDRLPASLDIFNKMESEARKQYSLEKNAKKKQKNPSIGGGTLGGTGLNISPFLHIYIYIYIYIYILLFFSLEVFTSALADSLSQKWNTSPQISRTLLSILADPNNVVVWMVYTRPLISKSSSPYTNLLVTLPKAQILLFSLLVRSSQQL